MSQPREEILKEQDGALYNGGAKIVARRDGTYVVRYANSPSQTEKHKVPKGLTFMQLGDGSIVLTDTDNGDRYYTDLTQPKIR